MIYILPVIHEVQSRNPKKLLLVKDFLTYLKKQIGDLKITLVVDEWCVDATNDRSGNTSNVEPVVQKLRVDYIQMEMTNAERKDKKIPLPCEIRKSLYSNYGPIYNLTDAEELALEFEMSKYFPVREAYWYNLIKDRLNENVIIICGRSHLSIGNKHLYTKGKGFDEFLVKKGHQVKILTLKFC